MLSTRYFQSVKLRPVSRISQIILVFAVLLGSNAPLQYFILQQPALIPLNTLLWLVLYCLALAGLFLSHGINWITWLVRYRLLLVTLLLGSVLLVPWSVDAALSVNRLTHLFGTTLIAVYIGFSLPLNSILKLFAFTLAGLLLLSLLLANLPTSYAWESYNGANALRGVMDNKNTLGFWAGISLLLFPWMAWNSQESLARVIFAALALLALIALWLSHSAGSIIATGAALLALLYIQLARKLALGFLALCLLAILMFVLAGLLASGLDVAELAGRSDDLTGRAEVWDQTWQLIQQRPLTGYGYGTLWFPTASTQWIQERFTDFTWVVYHAHNGFLQIASEIGLPLSALALLFVGQQLVEVLFCQFKHRSAGSLFTLGFLLAFLVSNYTEARFMQSRELFWLFFIALPVCLLRQVELRAGSRQKTPLPEPADDRVRLPDEFIPNPESKLARQRATKEARRLRRQTVARTLSDKPHS